MSKRVRCLHCGELLPAGPAVDATKVHVGSGEPSFADDTVVATIARHAPEHTARAWIEGRDYELVDDVTGE